MDVDGGFAYMVCISKIIPIMYVANKSTQVGNNVLRITESINVNSSGSSRFIKITC